MEAENLYQAGTSAEKLRGKYYTPPALVRLILEQVEAGASDIILDPSCGDGEFLVGAVRYLADTGAAGSADSLAARLVGVDVNPAAVEVARSRVLGAIQERLGVRPDPSQLRIYCANALEPVKGGPLEALIAGERSRLLVLGNPPYVEAKRLPREEKARLKARFPAVAAGSPDLYLFFLYACLQWLRPDDRLALVLPNRVLVNTNAREIRRALLSGAQLCAIDFATRTNLFEGAGVYPVVLYASGPSADDRSIALATIRREGDGLSRDPLPPLPLAEYARTSGLTFFPTPASPVLTEALRGLLRQVEELRLADLLDIRWAVSFHRRGLRERFVRLDSAGMKHGRKFLGGGTFAGNGDVTRYRAQWSGWWIDYDTEELRRLGNLLPPIATFDGPKIAICQNGRTVRAAFDDQSLVLKDTLLCGRLQPRDHPLLAHPRALVGLLCSRAVHFFYSHVFHGGHVNGGYLHFLRSFLNEAPVGNWSEDTAASLDALVKRREALPPGSEALEVETEIELLVETALGLSAEHCREIEEWAACDENWIGRDRTRRTARMMDSAHAESSS
ncbi:MAG: N-6 DNA methylase [Actinomycetota bacterium]